MKTCKGTGREGNLELQNSKNTFHNIGPSSYIAELLANYTYKKVMQTSRTKALF